MYEYTHGGNAAFECGNGGVIDLSASINPLGMPEGVRDAIIREISNCEHYPDSFSRRLREKISEFECVKPDCIFCGNGASDIIFRLPKAVQAKKIMVTAPSFSDYDRSACSYGAEVIRYALSPANSFDPDSGFVEAVRREMPDLVFVCNPNNPTGRLTGVKLIKELLDFCKGIGAWVAVDECFLDFSEKALEYTSKRFLEQYSNLTILKAFTKLFALPGIRLGYAICADSAFVNNLYFHGTDWPVSSLAQAAGIAALKDADRFIDITVSYVTAEREAINDELTTLGFVVFETHANYVFFQNPYHFDLREQLNRLGIRIRSCDNFYGLDESYYRIAVSTKENNMILLNAITEIVALRDHLPRKRTN